MGFKMAVDLVATVFLIGAMGFRITGTTMHEWIGAGAFALLIVHNLLNGRWYGALPKGKYGWFRLVNTGINVLLMVSILTLLVTGIMTSRVLFPFVSSPEGLFVRQLHVLSAYWSLVLTSIHLGFHWKAVMTFVRKMAGQPKSSRLWSTIFRLTAVLIAVFGVRASFDRNVGSKLVMYYSFDFWNSDESVVYYFGSYLAIMAVWGFAAYYTLKSIRYLFDVHNRQS